MVSDTTAGAPEITPVILGETGTNLTVDAIVRAASALQDVYARNGHADVSVAVGAQEMTNGVVTLHVFESAVPQIRIAGERYLVSSNQVEVTDNLLPPPVTNAPVAAVPPLIPSRPSKPPTEQQMAVREKIAQLDELDREAQYPALPPVTTQFIFARPAIDTNDAQVALRERMGEMDLEARRAGLVGPNTNSVASTNGQFFEVKGYELIGNSLLPTNITELVLQPYIGTNITFARLRAALTDLQTVYREHGFATISVTLPQQTLTNHIVKIRVFEGRLEQIEVVHNLYFSSNNIMRAMPSLHENMVLSAPVFQSELDRANANQDRQIYPSIEPGPVEGTTALKLEVKDRFPLHAKLEFNNQNSPGTPALRVNASAEYNNFWQLEHSLGIQYSFSPQEYKTSGDWSRFDQPLVANYSAFYRMPLGNPEDVANTLNSSTKFGFDEATRRFNLPPPSGQPELNIFASRSAIDTGLEDVFSTNILNQPGVRIIKEQDVQQDITINEDIGIKFSQPLPQSENWRSILSFGADFKTFESTSAKTNNFLFTEFFPQPDGTLLERNFTLPSGRAPTRHFLEYLPLSLRLDATKADPHGTTIVGLGLAGVPWHSGSSSNMQAVAGSKNATGYWVTFSPSITRDFLLPKAWDLSVHAEGQWASQPLISTEQFGAGGVNSVRGYHEGEVFGDKGWRVDCELKTPPHVVGIAFGKQPLTVRGSIFTDYSEVHLLDPQGRDGTVPLWGAGAGWVTSIGSHWEARFLFAVPFDSTPTTEANHPRFNFSLLGQF